MHEEEAAVTSFLPYFQHSHSDRGRLYHLSEADLGRGFPFSQGFKHDVVEPMSTIPTVTQNIILSSHIHSRLPGLPTVL